MNKGVEGDPKRFPRLAIGHKSNRNDNPLATATVPLGNSGITPPPQQLTSVNIDAQMDFYGTYILLNEQVTLQNQDPVLNEAAERLGVSLRQTEDELMRNMLAKRCGESKPWVIDMKALQGDMAQAQAA